MKPYMYSTVLLIALAFVVWSCSDNEPNMVGALGGEAVLEATPDVPNDKTVNVKPEALGGELDMSGIIGKGGNGAERVEKIQDYLSGKYKLKGKEVSVNLLDDGSIDEISFVGDFTPPGYVREKYVHEDIRASSLAFLTEERELFGAIDPENDLKAGEVLAEEVLMEGNSEETVLRFIAYNVEVEGLWVLGSAFIFVFTENAEPTIMKSWPRLVSPEMRVAAKKFRTVGVTAIDMKEAVRADLVKRGVSQANINELRFVLEPASFLVDEKPYVVWSLSVWYSGNEDDFAGWDYRFNAITGELVERIYIENAEIGE